MGKPIILEIYGDFEHGFAANLEVKKNQGRSYSCLKGKLPKNPDLLNQYRQWQALYRNLETLYRPLKDKPGQITNYSQKLEAFAACNLAAEVLEETMNTWLKSANSFRAIENELCQQLKSSKNVRVILRTNNSWLQRLPWHLWNLPSVTTPEIILSIPQYEVVEKPAPPPPKDKVRILAVFGPGMEPESERLVLEEADNAEIKILQEPLLEELNDELWERGCDILFFAGHSSSNSDGQDGEIQINKNYTLTIGKLKYSLKKAVNKGLRLAIFNSCDGLGLAYQLAEGEAIYLPFIIVMREPVPDDVAPKFLRYFLEEYAKNGTSLDNALRDARQRLQGLEQDYPCATWLPVICQSSEETPPTWQELLNETKSDRLPKIDWRGFVRVLIVSVLVTSLVMGVRSVGWLQSYELQAYDRLLQMRPFETEKLDPHLLIVGITDADIQRFNSPVSDVAVLQVLEKLNKYHPAVIGLDIFRDTPQGEGWKPLIKYLQNNKQVIATCFNQPDGFQGATPPPGVPEERLGFSDNVFDRDGVLRRHLLNMTITKDDPSPCKTEWSLNFLIATNYLQKLKSIKYGITKEEYIKLGKTLIKWLRTEVPVGGYQRQERDSEGNFTPDFKGFQILLNYRSSEQIAKTTTFTDVLEGRLSSENVENKVVLIGYTSHKERQDWHHTPYKEMPGVLIQAHMVSQLIDMALGQRPLLSVQLPQIEAFWVWMWSFFGGLIAWLFQSKTRLGATLVGVLSTLNIILVSLFLQGYFMPIIPSLLALVTAGVGMAISNHIQSWKLSNLLFKVGLLLSIVLALWILNNFCLVLLIKGNWMPLIPSALALIISGVFIVIYTRFQPRKQK